MHIKSLFKNCTGRLNIYLEFINLHVETYGAFVVGLVVVVAICFFLTQRKLVSKFNIEKF